MDSNPYQSPTTGTLQSGEIESPWHFNAGTVVRVASAIALLLYSLACIGIAGLAAHIWMQYPDESPGLLILLVSLLTGASAAVWAIGLLLRHRRLTWYGFLGFVLFILLVIAVVFGTARL